MNARIAERNARIIARAREGATTAELVREFGLGPDMIGQILRATGEAFPGRRHVPPGSWNAAACEARNAEIIALRRAGAYPREIAADMGLNISTVFRAIRDVADLPPLPDLRNRPGRDASRPATVERVRPAAAPKAPRTASDISPHSTAPTQISTRTCHACNIQIREADWPAHMAKVHKVVSKNQTQLTALERYIAQIQPEHEPARPYESPCRICHKTPCEAPIAHARITRMRDQHARRLELERLGKKAA